MKGETVLAMTASSLAQLAALLAIATGVREGGATLLASIALAAALGLASWSSLAPIARGIANEITKLASHCNVCGNGVKLLHQATETLMFVARSGPLLTATLSLATLPLQSLTYTVAARTCRTLLTLLAREGYLASTQPPREETASIIIAASAGLASPLVGVWLERVRSCIRAVGEVVRDAGLAEAVCPGDARVECGGLLEE